MNFRDLMKKTDYFSLRFINNKLVFLDQTRLPFQQVYIETDNYERIAEAIERLEIRGAPAIGIAAAYGAALAVKNVKQENHEEIFFKSIERLRRTRPTAVNLFHALSEMEKVFCSFKNSPFMEQNLFDKAKELHSDDIEKCRSIGKNGLAVFKKKSRVLTHCNTGKLAASGDGTAFNIINLAYEKGLVEHVFVDETRPLFQGLRLTSFELEQNGIPFTVNTDSMAAVLMKQNKIDLVLVGADRIALNGDTANKVGTYNLAVLSNFHDIPFFIAAPTSTIDRTILTGEDIVIEQRKKSEILQYNSHKFAPEHIDVFNPSFDVTPSHLITGIITEEQIYTFPYNFMI